MRPDPRPLLCPEAREALAVSERLQAGMGGLPAEPIAAMRAAYARERAFWNAAPVELAAVEDRTLDLAGLPTALRLYRPSLDRPLPVLLYLHGGGFVLGSLDTHDRIMRLLARLSGCAVLGVDYALAPEHRFPTQIEQIVAAVSRLDELPGLDPGTFALGGDSAGAHLALAVALALRDAGGPLPRCLLLYYGAYGLRDSASRRLWGGPVDGLGEDDLAFFRDSYLRSPKDARDPRYDLLAADLTGLPPTFIAACALDPLHDDSTALAGLLRAAGDEVELKVYEGVLHGFLHLSRMVPTAMEAVEHGARLIKARLPTPQLASRQRRTRSG